MMTESATKLVQPQTFLTLSRQPVVTDLWSLPSWQPEHIALAERAALLAVVPATANILGKMANGIADDALSTFSLSHTGPVLVAPAMNPRMWRHPAVQANCALLRQRGVLFVAPRHRPRRLRRRGDRAARAGRGDSRRHPGPARPRRVDSMRPAAAILAAASEGIATAVADEPRASVHPAHDRRGARARGAGSARRPPSTGARRCITPSTCPPTGTRRPGTPCSWSIPATGSRPAAPPGGSRTRVWATALAGGRRFLWITMPCVEKGRTENAVTWWGDREATVEYCKTNLPRVCAQFGGDPANVIVCGFSRGAIATSYIALADDGIAALWKAFYSHDHYDGQRLWPYPGSDPGLRPCPAAPPAGTPRPAQHHGRRRGGLPEAPRGSRPLRLPARAGGGALPHSRGQGDPSPHRPLDAQGQPLPAASPRLARRRARPVGLRGAALTGGRWRGKDPPAARRRGSAHTSGSIRRTPCGCGSSSRREHPDSVRARWPRPSRARSGEGG